MIDDGLIAAMGNAAATISPIVGGYIGSASSLRQLKKANEYNRSMAEYQYDKNLEMWNLQNQYNLPSEQIQRFKDAGLNPNLMYGQGTNGNASSGPEMEIPNYQAYTGFGDFGFTEAGAAMSNGLNKVADYELKKEQADMVRQNTQNLQTDNEFRQLQITAQALHNAKTAEEREIWSRYLSLQLDQIESNISFNTANTKFTQMRSVGQIYDNAKAQILLPYVAPIAQNELINIMARTGLINAQTNHEYYKRLLTGEQILTEKQERALKVIQGEYVKAKTAAQLIDNQYLPLIKDLVLKTMDVDYETKFENYRHMDLKFTNQELNNESIEILNSLREIQIQSKEFENNYHMKNTFMDYIIKSVLDNAFNFIF